MAKEQRPACRQTAAQPRWRLGSAQEASRPRHVTGEPAAALADCHVHFHDCYDLETFLESSVENFRAGAAQLGVSPKLPGILLLSETSNDHFFARFAERTQAPGHGAWTIRPTAEPTSLVLEKDGARRLIVIAGRQITTREGLEVLALNSSEAHPDNLNFEHTLRAVLASGCLTVVPWGFGKWWFRRGGIVRRAVRTTTHPTFFLGDNAGRLGMGRPPRVFAQARSVGVRVLPGSDPLPLRSDVNKVGRYGCLVRGPLDFDYPAASVVRALVTSRSQPRVYGHLEGLRTFCSNQFTMQARKRFGGLRG